MSTENRQLIDALNERRKVLIAMTDELRDKQLAIIAEKAEIARERKEIMDLQMQFNDSKPVRVDFLIAIALVLALILACIINY